MGRLLGTVQGACLGILGSLTVSAPHSSAADSFAPVETAAVMAPLSIESPAEMQQFEAFLSEAAALGVNAVTVDVWWGKVETAGDQQFDWSYYDTVFQKIDDSGLEIVPIMSFHKCGGGPGDNCDIPLPNWLWTHFQNVGLGPDDLKYESEFGQKKLDDAIVPWATEHPAVVQQFVEFMDAFEQHFANRAPAFVELNISLGPTGELRYPAYNGDESWHYPDRGNFQAYSALARAKFRDWALSSFGGLSGVSNRWGLPLASPDDIRPPGGHLPPGTHRAQSFVDQRDYEDSQYGRDFIDWYHGSLVGHGKRLLLAADQAFDQSMSATPLGMKIPGVHWQIQCTVHPRIAEITAGLVRTSLDLRAVGAARSDSYGYKSIMETIQQVKQTAGRDVILHFTALEMDNDPGCAVGTSMAEALVFWISHGASDHGIQHKGENALACVDGPEAPNSADDRNWGRIRNAFSNAPYQGFTSLRLVNDGCNPWADRQERLRGVHRAPGRVGVLFLGAGLYLPSARVRRPVRSVPAHVRGQHQRPPLVVRKHCQCTGFVQLHLQQHERVGRWSRRVQP
jgi:beta-amylase